MPRSDTHSLVSGSMYASWNLSEGGGQWKWLRAGTVKVDVRGEVKHKAIVWGEVGEGIHGEVLEGVRMPPGDSSLVTTGVPQ